MLDVLISLLDTTLDWLEWALLNFGKLLYLFDIEVVAVEDDELRDAEM